VVATKLSPNAKEQVTAPVPEKDIVSKSKNSPFIGKKLKGKNKYTIVKGKVVYGEE